MHPVQDERVEQVRAAGVLEQPRPQVVVLALLEARVVAERVPVEQLAVDEHRRVVEGRAEEGAPAHLAGLDGHRLRPPHPALLVELEHGRADDADRRRRAQAGELALEPPRKRHVVRVEPRNVAPACLVEAPVQRAREPGGSVVSEHAEPRVRERGEDFRCPVGRGVVDDEHLEVGKRLTESALDGRAHVRLPVADGEEHRDERRGRHCAVAYGACRGTLRRST